MTRRLRCYRICPGRFLADANVWLVIANVLAAFDILPAIDPDTGAEILPEFGWSARGITVWAYCFIVRNEKVTSSFPSKLKPFGARIVPRSGHHARLVSQDWCKPLDLLLKVPSSIYARLFVCIVHIDTATIHDTCVYFQLVRLDQLNWDGVTKKKK